MGLEEKLPSGFLLTTVEQAAGWVRKSSMFPETFGLAGDALGLGGVRLGLLHVP